MTGSSRGLVYEGAAGEWTANTVEVSEVTRPEPESLFSLGFWLACEREAARIVRTMTDVDDGQVGRHATAPAQSARPPVACWPRTAARRAGGRGSLIATPEMLVREGEARNAPIKHPSSRGRGMRSISVQEFDGTVVLEVDGVLDIVTGHDLRRLVAESGGPSCRSVVLDLTRVGAVDGDGVAALQWCSDWAVQQRKVLRWSGCSGPTRAALAQRPRLP